MAYTFNITACWDSHDICNSLVHFLHYDRSDNRAKDPPARTTENSRISELVRPGAYALTLMPCGPHSAADIRKHGILPLLQDDAYLRIPSDSESHIWSHHTCYREQRLRNYQLRHLPATSQCSLFFPAREQAPINKVIRPLKAVMSRKND